MIRGETYYFFRLDRVFNDPHPDYYVAKSFEDLKLRLGEFFMSQYQFVVQLDEFTIEHIRAIERFLIQQIS